jgi:molybdopterin molybdotransferase
VPGANVRPAGEDFAAGTRLVESGAVIDAGVIAIMAALGHGAAEVALAPRVAVLSTGDELVPPGRPRGPGQVHDSNTHMVRALLRAAGAEPGPCWHLADDPAAVREAIARVRDHCDVILTLGGISTGDFDPVRQALAEGVGGATPGRIELWRVGMRPGQPQAFGTIDGRLFFGLPGNPVSAAVAFETLVRPALWALLGRRTMERPTVTAVLDGPVASRAGRRDFVRVRLEALPPDAAARAGAAWRARLAGSQSSGAISAVLRADGLAVIDEGVELAPAGAVVPVLLWRPLSG